MRFQLLLVQLMLIHRLLLVQILMQRMAMFLLLTQQHLAGVLAGNARNGRAGTGVGAGKLAQR